MAKIASLLRKDNARQSAQGGRGSANEAERSAEIQRVAYQFFAERGYEHGHDLEDWLRAEAFVKARRS